MAKLVSANTERRILQTINAVENMTGASRQPTRRRVRTGGSGGGSLVYATSPNTTLDASYIYGATFDAPAGTGTALPATAVFKLSTPWNTAVTAPTALFTFWNKIGDVYYKDVIDFYVKCTINYTADTGVGTFSVYYDKDQNTSLGTNTNFPSGVKALASGFTASTAGTSSQAWFNGRVLKCRYSPSDNIIYMDYIGF